MTDDAVRRVEARIEKAGLTAFGWFEPLADDGLGELGSGRPARSAVLVGNAGPAMWEQFSRTRDPADKTLDRWTADEVSDIARDLGGRAYFPFDKPALPFQRWAQRCGQVFTSPLGLTIHPTYGLWHAFRAVIVFTEVFSGTAPVANEHPCESCTDKPCLSTCPVDAFQPGSYDVQACAEHMRTPAGKDCLTGACLARRACPIGRDYIYEPPQAEFHMQAFVKAIPRAT